MFKSCDGTEIYAQILSGSPRFLTGYRASMFYTVTKISAEKTTVRFMDLFEVLSIVKTIKLTCTLQCSSFCSKNIS